MRSLLRALPWIAILVTIGIVQLVRDAPIDAAIFGAVAVALALDAVGLFSADRPVRAPLGAVLVGAGVAAVVLILVPRHGLAAAIVVLAVGIGAAVLAWPNGAVTRRRDRRILAGSLLWAGVTVALCLLELTSFLAGRADEDAKLAHPAVSDLLDPLVDTWPGRAAFVVLWIAAGVGFTRAGRRS